MAFMETPEPSEPESRWNGIRLHEWMARQAAQGKAPWQQERDRIDVAAGLDEELPFDDTSACGPMLVLAAVAQQQGFTSSQWLTRACMEDLGLQELPGQKPVTLKVPNPAFATGEEDCSHVLLAVCNEEQTTLAKTRRGAAFPKCPDLETLNQLVKASGIVAVDSSPYSLLRGVCRNYVQNALNAKAQAPAPSGHAKFFREHLQTDIATWFMTGRLGIENRESFPFPQFRADLAAFIRQRPNEISRAAEAVTRIVRAMERDTERLREPRLNLPETAWALTAEEIESIGREKSDPPGAQRGANCVARASASLGETARPRAVSRSGPER